MGLRERIVNALSGDKHVNRIGRNDFLKYGNRGVLDPAWSEVKMSDEDMYRGYSYAVIQKRGNKVASLARENLRTNVTDEALDIFQKKGVSPEHPYLKVIRGSERFTEKQFWKTISIYLDLAGRYYLGVVRRHIPSRASDLPDINTDVKEFILLNPYEVRRVINSEKKVAGYIERKKDGRYREWPIHQIIEMRELNPFDSEGFWAMTDAAKEAVYAIQKSGDYTRKSLVGNIDAPGIITTDVILDDEDFDNFTARVREHRAGEPIFGNGAGAISWQSMQVDLDKAALLDINEINRTTLFAVSGTSKTSLGIEQSGTTRETARVQSEQFVSDTAQPRLEDIIDFLNLDYKRRYPDEFKKIGYSIEVQSAVGADYDSQTKAVALRQSEFMLSQSLVQAGYTKESAAQYAVGDIELGDLELQKGLDNPKTGDEPEESQDGGDAPDEPKSPSGGGGQQNGVLVENGNPNHDPKKKQATAEEGGNGVEKNAVEKEHTHTIECSCKHNNDISSYEVEESEELEKSYNDFLAEVREVEKETLEASIDNVSINAFSESDLISKTKKEKLKKRLANYVKKYWAVLMPLFGNSVTVQRNSEFGVNEVFKVTNDLEDEIAENADRVADGHLETIMHDILDTSNKAYSDVVENAAAELIVEAYRDDPDKWSKYFDEVPSIERAKKAIQKTDILERNRKIYEKANQMAFEGYDRGTIVQALRGEYEELSQKRATTIARNETARAFSHSQYAADYQFLKNIGRLDNAYKELYSRTGNPCPYCQALIDKGPIPFTENFLDYGESVEVVENGKVKKFTANYEKINAGSVHCNCRCTYRLVFLNDLGEKNVYDSLLREGDDNSNNSCSDWVLRNSDFGADEKEVNGGKGSGNFGHAGRPGEVGGSGKGGSLEYIDKSNSKQFENLQKVANWTKDEVEVASQYFGGRDYQAIQEYLRGGDDVEMGNGHKTSEAAEILDKKAKNTELPSDTTLYRGMYIRNDRIERIENNGFEIPTLQSASLDKGRALTAGMGYLAIEGNAQRGQVALLKINAKKGSKGVASYTAGETEMVLPTRTKFKIKNKSQKNGYVEYEVDYE